MVRDIRSSSVQLAAKHPLSWPWMTAQSCSLSELNFVPGLPVQTSLTNLVHERMKKKATNTPFPLGAGVPTGGRLLQDCMPTNMDQAKRPRLVWLMLQVY